MSQSLKQDHWNTTARVVAGLLLVVGIVTPVGADDVFPPSWRGQPLSITQGWDEWTNFPVGMPPDYANPPMPGTAIANPTLMGKVNVFGRTNVLTNTHITPLPMWGLDFFLVNFPVPNAEKRIRLQITYNANGAAPSLPAVQPDNGSWIWFSSTPSAITAPDANGWVTAAYDMAIQPNPQFETISFQFDFIPPLGINRAYVDQVVIDTICIPEPAGGLLVLLGSACLLGRGRRAMV